MIATFPQRLFCGPAAAALLGLGGCAPLQSEPPAISISAFAPETIHALQQRISGTAVVESGDSAYASPPVLAGARSVFDKSEFCATSQQSTPACEPGATQHVN